MKLRSLLSGTAMAELIIITICSIILYFLAGHYDVLEEFMVFLHRYEEWEVDEVIVVGLFLTLAFSVFSYRRLREQILLNLEIERQNKEITETMTEIRQLKEIIPICSHCRKLRDDDGFWHQVEAYFSARTSSAFSHGICPDCMEKYYPEYANKKPHKEG